MKKLDGPQQMEGGKIYNLVYSGSNEAYGRINGKRTILVLETTPEFRCVELYGQFGCPSTDDLRSDTITAGSLAVAFKEDDIFVPENEGEWFKKSAKVTTLADGIEQGILTLENIQKHPVQSSHCPFTAVNGTKGNFLGLYTSFKVEGQTNQPFLQRVYVWWDTWEEMHADFNKFGVNAKR